MPSCNCIRAGFQRILAIMNVHCRYAALKTAEDKGWMYTKKSSEKGKKCMHLHYY